MFQCTQISTLQYLPSDWFLIFVTIHFRLNLFFIHFFVFNMREEAQLLGERECCWDFAIQTSTVETFGITIFMSFYMRNKHWRIFTMMFSWFSRIFSLALLINHIMPPLDTLCINERRVEREKIKYCMGNSSLCSHTLLIRSLNNTFFLSGFKHSLSKSLIIPRQKLSLSLLSFCFFLSRSCARKSRLEPRTNSTVRGNRATNARAFGK
jgi:hypothetical protein